MSRLMENLRLIDEEQPRFQIGSQRYQPAYFARRFGSRTGVTSTEVTLLNTGRNDQKLRTAPVTMYASCEDDDAVGTFRVIAITAPDFRTRACRVTLTGQTPAAITANDGSPILIYAVERMFQISAASVSEPTGDVWVAEADTVNLGVPQTADLIEARVQFVNAAQQTQKAAVIVPEGRYGLVTGFRAFMAQASGTSRHAEVGLEVRELAEGANLQNNPTWAPRRRVDELAISTASPEWENNYEFPLMFGEGTCIEVRATASASSKLFGGFTVLMVRDTA